MISNITQMKITNRLTHSLSLSSSMSSTREHLLGSSVQRHAITHLAPALAHEHPLVHLLFLQWQYLVRLYSTGLASFSIMVATSLPLTSSLQQGKLAQTCVLVYIQPTDAGLCKGVIGRHLQ